MRARTVSLSALFIILAAVLATGKGPHFYDDDPIAHEPRAATRPARRAVQDQPFYEYRTSSPSPARPEHPRRERQHHRRGAGPSWFTNRIGTVDLAGSDRPRPADRRTAGSENGVIRGATPAGFTATTPTARRFLSFDAPENPEGASSIVAIANKLFWALWHNQIETFITTLIRRTDPKARRSALQRALTQDDVDAILERTETPMAPIVRLPVSSLGKILGPFATGTRPDDPSTVPHEHRRELRALRVFGAWTIWSTSKP
jgi:hypothetical protein